MTWTYQPRTGRYRDAAGRFLSATDVRAAVDRLADHTSQRAEDLTRRLVAPTVTRAQLADSASIQAADLARQLQAGSLSLADWQQSMMMLMKSAHLAAGIAAHGGRAAMDQATYGAIGRQLRDQYAYLRGFANQIADGSQPLDGRLIARARLYGQAARSTHEAVRARDDRGRGMTEEMNVLHGGDHCHECPELSSRGWVSIGSLPPIGSRECGVNDRCTVARR